MYFACKGHHMKPIQLFINSTVVFVIAAIAEMTIHECGHFFTGLACGGHPVLHHNSVQHMGVRTETMHIIEALAGPLVSLLMGILFHVLLQQKKHRGIMSLFLFYMSAFSYIGFFGYMFIAPFFAYGDTGYVLRAIGCPGWLIITLAITAAFILYLLMRKLAVHIVALMSSSTAADLQLRRRFVSRIIFLPLMAGMAITTLLNLPVPTPLSLIAPLTSPVTLLWAYGDYIRQKQTYADETESINNKLKPLWWVALLVVIIVNRLLVSGISI